MILAIGMTFATSQSFARTDVEVGLTKIGVAKLGESGYASSIRSINQAGAKTMQKNAAGTVGASCQGESGCWG
jgi:hypothetical protein